MPHGEEAGRPAFVVENERKIPDFMRELLQNYDKIRGKSKKELGEKFWDAVVITASDTNQKSAFEEQVAEKLEKNEIPSGVHYLLYADPPGTRAGCGTSTMFVLEELRNRFGSELDSWKVLLLNAGGQSQRLPSASVLGKIFTPLPIGRPMYQMIDMKLANYLPFLPRMGPGFLHAASDTIETFDLGGEECKWNWDNVGFTVSAQPASLEIGAGHGVYVISDEQVKKKHAAGDNIKAVPAVEMLETLEVLQKPSRETMLQKGAVFNRDANPWVYTDCIFFFDHSTAEKLRDFYSKHKPLECEIDSYGDFLQALGTRAEVDYTNNTRNVGKVEPKLIDTRQKIFHLLKGTPISTVALNVSKFYHFGTMHEYIYHFCEDEILAKELNFNRSAFSKLFESLPVSSAKHPKRLGKIDGCVMHSYLPISSEVEKQSIVEYCQFTVPVYLKANCILSNCCYEDDDLTEMTIPENCFMHTVPIIDEGSTVFVTVFFGTFDDIKKKVSLEDAGSLKFCGKPLSATLDKSGMKISEIFQDNGSKCSLWSAKMFEGRRTMTDSFSESLKKMHLLLGSETVENKKDDATSLRMFSMSDILEQKDVKSMLKFRNTLYELIDREIS